ncbi:MAG TPA: hypothetical protein VKB84_20140 [Candidatus Binataceae bacterium]|jgi:hypothetical protein|nr:hypothetical protein [Candidatus Binataceae bacterium]
MEPDTSQGNDLLSLMENDYRQLAALSAIEQWAYHHLYDQLNVIDAKASSLLRVNSTIMGFLATILTLMSRVHQLDPIPYRRSFLIAGAGILALFAVADIIGLRSIFWLKYFSFEDAHFEQYRRDCFTLIKSRGRRLKQITILSFMGELGFAALFILLVIAELTL